MTHGIGGVRWRSMWGMKSWTEPVGVVKGKGWAGNRWIVANVGKLCCGKLWAVGWKYENCRLKCKNCGLKIWKLWVCGGRLDQLIPPSSSSLSYIIISINFLQICPSLPYAPILGILHPLPPQPSYLKTFKQPFGFPVLPIQRAPLSSGPTCHMRQS